MTELRDFVKMPTNSKFKFKFFMKQKKRIAGYLKRRPHRSFRLTRKRDYQRSLEIPGLWKFTMMVNKVMWSNRKLFLLLALTYGLLSIFMVGIASQSSYSTLVDTIQATGGNLVSSGWGKIGEAGILFVATMTGSISENLTEAQQIYAGILILLTWMTSVWLLRNILAKNKVKLRDGLYNAGSPILSTFIVSIIIIIQLVPAGLAMVGFGAASATGLLNNGVEAMLFWVVAGLLSLISVYFVISSLFALVIITLPGMYPFEAIKMSGDLVVGRRLRILGRLVWALFLIAVVWVIILIPLIMLDNWLSGVWSVVNSIPVIPIAFLTLTSLTIIWASSYLYLLYREIIKDDSQSA